MEMTMSLPLDGDGFLRRECPNCERQFKWRPTAREDDATDPADPGEVGAYFCPHCYEPAAPGTWWTKEQVEYGRARAMTEVVRPQVEKFKRSISSLNRPGGLLRVDVTGSAPPDPEPLTEPDDMVRVDLPCHLEEPIKIEEAWDGEVACLICGIRYPVDLVRALPDGNVEA